MDVVTLEIVFAQGEPFYATGNFKEVLRDMLPRGRTVLAVVVQESNLKFYYNEFTVDTFLSGRYSYEEFYEASWCDGLYRNTIHLFTNSGQEVEPGCLWLLRGDILILLDADQDVRAPFNTQQQLFEKIV